MRHKPKIPMGISLFVLDMVLAILFLAVFVAAILPSIGLGFLLEPWWGIHVEPHLSRLILGAIGFVVCQLIFDRRTMSQSLVNRITSIEDTNKAIEDTNAAIESRFANCIPSARVNNRRDESYSHLRYQLSRLPEGTQLLVTHFEKYRAVSYDQGVRDAEHEFMLIWEKLIHDDLIDVKQIVHVSSRFDLQEVRDRLKRYDQCQNFEMSVMAGPFVLPYQDLIIAEGHWVEVALPDDPNNPYSEKIAVFLDSPEIADAYAAAFMANWGASECKVVRASGVVNTSLIEHLDALLPDEPNEGLMSDLKTLPCEVAALGDEGARLLGQCISLIRDLARRARVSEYSRHLFERFTKLQASLVEERESPFIVNGTLASQSLIEMANSAKHSIVAVSVDQTSSSFWETQFGKEFLAANQSASQRGVPVSRVFVIDNHGNKRGAPAIREHEKFANCRVVARKDTGITRDFIIVDSEVLYEVITESQGAIQRGHISIGDNSLQSGKHVFDELWNISQTPNKFFRSRNGRT